MVDTVVPRGKLDARNDDPRSFSVALGEVVTTIEPGKQYVVLEVARVKSLLLRKRYYLRIREYDTEGPRQRREC